MGSIWEGFGTIWGLSWSLLGHFLGLRNEAFIKHWSKMVSKRPSGSILEGFGEGSGRIWEGLGRILANFWMDFGHTNLNTFLQFCVFFRTFDL